MSVRSGAIKGHFVIVLLCLVVLMTGCWDRREVDLLAFVTATGVDPVESGEPTPHGWTKLELSVQIAGAEGGEQGSEAASGGSGGEPPTGLVVSGTGFTPLDGLLDIQSRLGRITYVAHNRVVVISNELAHGKMDYVMDFFDRSRQTRRAAFLVIAEGITAKKVLEAQFPLTGRSGEGLFELVRLNHDLRGLPMVTVHDFLVAASLEGVDPFAGRIVPASATNPEEAPGEMSSALPLLRYAGLGLFQGDRYVGHLDDLEARGFLWATGNISAGFVDVPCPQTHERAFFYDVQRSSGKVGVETKPQLRGTITITMEGRLGDVECPGGFERSSEGVVEAHKLAEEAVTAQIKSAIERTKELGTDPFGFGAALMRKSPSMWKHLRDHWYDQVWPQMPVDIDLKLDIRRPGITGKPYTVSR